jgi:uncharacterized protein
MTIRRRLVVALLASTFILPTGDRAMAQRTTETENRNKALVQAGFDAWKAGTGSPFELLADDANWTIVGNSDAANTYPNKEVFLREVIRPFNARMKEGITPTIRSLHADGDAVIIFFDAAGTARDGKPYTNTYAWFFEMRDGKVVCAWAFFDSLAFNDLWRRLRP